MYDCIVSREAENSERILFVSYLTKRIKRESRKKTLMVEPGIKPIGRPLAGVGHPAQMTVGESIWARIRSQQGVLQARLSIGRWEVNIWRRIEKTDGRKHQRRLMAHYVVMMAGERRTETIVQWVPAWYPVARVLNLTCSRRIPIVFKAK